MFNHANGKILVSNNELNQILFYYSSLTTLIEDIKFKRLDSRILEFLRSFKTDEISIKNSEIAKYLCTSRAVVNRVLQGKN